MSDESKQVVAPVATEAAPTTSPAPQVQVEEKKKSSALPKILIVLVVALCLCVLCAGAAWYIFTQVLNNTANTLNNAFVDTVMNSTNQNTNSTDSTDDTSSNSDSSYTFEDEDGTGSFSFGTSVPANFPSDIPIYSGATASFSSSDTNSEGKAESSVTFAVEAKATDVVNFYKSGMTSAGYDFVSEVNFFGNVMTFENSNTEVIVSVIGTDEEANVVLSIIATEK